MISLSELVNSPTILVRYAGSMMEPFASPVASSTLTANTNTHMAINRCKHIAIVFMIPKKSATEVVFPKSVF